MAKVKQYTLVEKIEHIQPIIKKYRQILSDKNSNVIEKFTNVEYWYYFPGINIFAPNLFLAYQEMASEPYPEHPKEDYGMDGGRARKKLKKYFDEVNGDEKEKLKEKLKKFVNDYGTKIKKQTKMGEEIHILELHPQFIDLFIDNEITSNENLIENPILEKPSKILETKKIDKSIPESSYKIAQRCEKLVMKINKIRIVFDKENAQDSWIFIREPIESEADFFMSINKLCIIVKEDTRDKNPNFKPGKRNGPYYYNRFPDNAKKIKLFIEDVEIIRNYVDHKENNESKSKYIKVCKKYTKIERVPIKIEEFQEFQINILSEFEVSLKELLNILLEN